MPQAGQIRPVHRYPHNYVVVNDNTQVIDEVTTESDDSIRMLFVFASPKGVDGKIQTIENGTKGFVEMYGQGPFSLYGQPYLNAYNAFSTGNIVGHCLRVSASNATYSYSVLVALYKIDETGKMTVKFKTRTPAETLTNLDDIDDIYTSPKGVISDGSEDDGFTEVKLWTIASKGRGVYGNKLLYGVSSNNSGDKENDYKNYIFTEYENFTGLTPKMSFSFCISEDSVINNESMFVDGVINDLDKGSSRFVIQSHPESFAAILDAYVDSNPGTTLTINDFDFLLGVNKYTKEAIDNYEIDTTSEGVVVLNGIGGISLSGGDDGDFGSDDPKVRTAALNEAYRLAFAGDETRMDPMIKSKNKYPTDLILDANFDIPTKIALVALADARKDCGYVLDCGLDIKTKDAPLKYSKLTAKFDDFSTSRNCQIDAICGKVRDPYSKKIVTVTETCALASAYPNNWAENGGKHVPFAGNKHGVLDDYFIRNSIYPLFDEDIHSDIMDEMVESRINFAKINSNQEIVRATQTTRQEALSNLSEANNAFVLLDIKRDCEKLCDEYQYDFSEPEDIAQFNKDVETVMAKYNKSQIRSVEASFDKNDWEAARGILHLYVGMEHKDLVKTTIIEIDVNRGSVSTSNE